MLDSWQEAIPKLRTSGSVRGGDSDEPVSRCLRLQLRRRGRRSALSDLLVYVRTHDPVGGPEVDIETSFRDQELAGFLDHHPWRARDRISVRPGKQPLEGNNRGIPLRRQAFLGVLRPVQIHGVLHL